MIELEVKNIFLFLNFVVIFIPRNSVARLFSLKITVLRQSNAPKNRPYFTVIRLKSAARIQYA